MRPSSSNASLRRYASMSASRFAVVAAPAQAGNRRFWPLSALRAHTKAPQKTDLLLETLRPLKRPGRARTSRRSPLGLRPGRRRRLLRRGLARLHRAALRPRPLVVLPAARQVVLQARRGVRSERFPSALWHTLAYSTTQPSIHNNKTD